MKRILFVDDDVNILEGLRRLMRSRRHEWEMEFASGGIEAVRLVDAQAFDVVVTDMRMPVVDGATLLRHVQRQHPQAIRIVLSGHTEVEAALRAAPVAHQFLLKPCDPTLLREAIERACNLQGLLGCPEVRRAVASIGSLPSVPEIHAHVTEALSRNPVDLDDVARFVERDVAMTAKALQLVNSAFFGLPRRVTSVRDAVNLLGTNMLKHLVLSVEVMGTMISPYPDQAEADRVHRHALLVGSIAMRILKDHDRVASEDAYVAGLLHDIGGLVLRSQLGETYAQVREESLRTGTPQHEVEVKYFGASHAEVGGYLLGVWGLPYPVVEAVAYHHTPHLAPATAFGVLDAVYVSEALAELVSRDAGMDAVPKVSAELLMKKGMTHKLPEWIDMARALATRDLEAA